MVKVIQAYYHESPSQDQVDGPGSSEGSLVPQQIPSGLNETMRAKLAVSQFTF